MAYTTINKSTDYFNTKLYTGNGSVRTETGVGFQPDIEVHIHTPEQTEARGYGRFWNVSFEAGPFEWAVHASMVIDNPNWYVEPYYSFDLQFCE